MKLTKDGALKIIDDNSSLIPTLLNMGWEKVEEIIEHAEPVKTKKQKIKD